MKTFEIINVLFLLSEAEVRSPRENKCLCNLCSQLVSNVCKVVQFREIAWYPQLPRDMSESFVKRDEIL